MIGMHIYHHGDHVQWELYLWAPPKRLDHYSECKAWSRTGTVPLQPPTDDRAALVAVLRDLLDRLGDDLA